MTKQNSYKEKDWTEPSHFSKKDQEDLKEIKRLYEAGKFKEAYDYACNRDTIIREEIPSAIWKEIGGQLTRSGEEKLRQVEEREKNLQNQRENNEDKKEHKISK